MSEMQIIITLFLLASITNYFSYAEKIRPQIQRMRWTFKKFGGTQKIENLMEQMPKDIDQPVTCWFTLVQANCHSPTQPQLELELDIIMGRKPPLHPTHRNF
jgi:hypothetical protein